MACAVEDEEVAVVQACRFDPDSDLAAGGFGFADIGLDEATDTVIINEVNTMPGFTPISMYPQMWAAAGLNYSDLLSELLTEASTRPLGLR